MSRPKGSRNKITATRMAHAISQLEPMKALDIMNLIRSNELWQTAVRIAIAENDAKALVKILTYLDDKAFGRAAETIAVEVKHHHTVEMIDRARSIAREIMEHATPVTIKGE